MGMIVSLFISDFNLFLSFFYIFLHKNFFYFFEKSFIFLKKSVDKCRMDGYNNGAWFVGQAVKTPPSHGGNTSSILVRTVKACCLSQQAFFLSFFFCFTEKLFSIILSI